MSRSRLPYQSSTKPASPIQPKTFSSVPALAAYTQQVKQNQITELEGLKLDCSDPDMLAFLDERIEQVRRIQPPRLW